MRRLAALLLLAAPLAAPLSAQVRSDLSVLLVGHDPEAPQVPFPQMATERTRELYRERTAAWRALLQEHFTSVRVVHGADYTASMSDEVDVTLFDARPRALTEAVHTPEYEPARYLPDDFSRPALMIAENSPRIGEPLGLKLDWL